MSERPPFEVARIDELESLPGPGTLRWTPLRRPLDVTAFGINAYTSTEAGQDVVEEHTERTLGHEEIYVVLTGRATFRLGDEEHDAPAGTLVFIRDPTVRRGATAADAGTTVLAIGGRPGSHEVSDWEYSFAAYGHLKEGDAERGLAVVREGIAAKGESPRLLYDLACFESLAGRREEAIGHLVRAVELDPQYREYASDDSDLDAIRDDPRFPR
jgi:quercetin dioxygenase-like cupin family protein